MSTDRKLDEAVARAGQGDRDALESVVEQIQAQVYGLAVRMLWHPEDARDATQEILVRVITRLASFRGESGFRTWVYRVATNYLLDVRRSRHERAEYTFERFGAELDQDLSETTPAHLTSADEALLLEEIKIGCTLGMLSCLDRPHRLAYVLGEILELDGDEASAILEISPEAFRKRLSRARREIVDFTRAKCGLVAPDASCRCRRRLKFAVESGRVDPSRPLFARDRERARAFPDVLRTIRSLEESRRAAALYRSHPNFSSTENFARAVRDLLDVVDPPEAPRG